MKKWEKNFLNYCMKKRFLDPAQIKEIEDELEKDKSGNENVLSLVSLKMGWDESQAKDHLAQACYKTKKTQKVDRPADIDLPKKHSLSSKEISSLFKKDQENSSEEEDSGENNIHMDAPMNILDGKSDSQKLGPYILVEKIGAGGMGVVYKTYHPGLDQYFAIKTLISIETEKDDRIKRFLQEARVMAKLRHPNIVAVHDIGQEKDYHYIVMDYIKGKHLGDIISSKKLYPRFCLEIVKQLAMALETAHKNGIIHRDIKPSNILITDEGHPYLTDFGIAFVSRREEAGLTKSGQILGTPKYMSPEQAMGKKRLLDGRSDIYSLGVVLYEMLTGKSVIQATEPMQIIFEIIDKDPIPVSYHCKRIAPDIEAITMKCLEKDPQYRYQSAAEMAEDIDHYLRGEVVGAKYKGTQYVFRKFFKWIVKNKLILLLAFLPVVVLFIYFFFFAYGTLSITPTSHGMRLSSGEIIINGQSFIGGLNEYSLFPGSYDVSIVAKDYERINFSVKIESNKYLSLEKELIRNKGKVTVTSSLSEIETVLKNTVTGAQYRVVSPIDKFEVDVGSYEVTFNKKNHFPKIVNVNIEKGEAEYTLNVKLEPMLLWRKEVASSSDLSKVCVADLDRNGDMELIYSINSGSIGSCSLHKDEKYWEIPNEFADRDTKLLLRDINKDGIPDILSGHPDRFMVIDGKTHEEIFSVPSWWGQAFTTGDANGDGYEDIILFTRQKGIECYDCETKDRIWSVPIEFRSQCIPVFIDPFHLVHAIEGEVYILDIRNSQRNTIFYGKNKIDYTATPYNIEKSFLKERPIIFWNVSYEALYCMDLKLNTILWSWDHRLPSRVRVDVYDVDGDCEEEVLINIEKKLYCRSASTGKEKWSVNSGSTVDGTAIGDLDGDGNIEIVLGTTEGHLYIFDGKTGREIEKFIITTPIGKPILFDTDGDGILEIIFPSGVYIYCIKHKPNQYVKIIDEDPRVLNSPPPSLNVGNGNYLVIGNKSGGVYCLDMKNSTVKWRFNIEENISCELGTAYITKGNTPEIIIPTDKYISTIDYNGKEIWKRELKGNMVIGKSVAADVDKDGIKDIILITTGNPSYIYCIDGKTGEIHWEKAFGVIRVPPFILDVDNDQSLDVLVVNDAPPELVCIEGNDGKKKWSAPLQLNSKASDIVGDDIDGDGYKEIFVPQMGGYVTCVNGRKGQIRWNRRLFGNISAAPILGDFDGDKKLEIILLSEDENIYCLDAKNGTTKWFRMGSGFSTGGNSHILHAKLDDDDLSDVIATGVLSYFYFLSGKDGRWLGEINTFVRGKSSLQMKDIDGDGIIDIVFVDSKSRLTCIWNAIEYFRQFIRTTDDPKIGLYDPMVTLARINKFLGYKAYDRIEKEIKTATESWDSDKMRMWGHILEFYKGVCALSKCIHEQALNHFQRARAMPSKIFDNEFLMAITYLKLKKNEDAQSVIKLLINKSVIEFDQCCERYKSLFSQEIIEALRTLVYITVKETGCDVKLDMAYQSAVFLGNKHEANRLLELSLTYGTNTSPNHQERYDYYIKKIVEGIKEKWNKYHQHEAFAILDRALYKLPFSKELLAYRAEFWRIFGIVEEKGR